MTSLLWLRAVPAALALAASVQVPSIPIRPQSVLTMNLEAEQSLPSLAPATSDPIHLLGKLFRPLGRTGTVPQEYTPQAGRGFSVEAQLLDWENADLIKLSDHTLDEVLFQEADGKTLVRKFVHPLEQDGPPAPGRWSATPTSSTRSLLVSDREEVLRPFCTQ